MSVAAVPATSMLQVPPAVKGVTRRPAPRYEMIVTRISANHFTVTSESSAFDAYDVTRDGPDASWACECPSFVRGHRVCKHIVKVEEFDRPAPAPTTSGSVMDVLARKRALVDAIREDRVLPFPAPTSRYPVTSISIDRPATGRPACVECGEPASVLYTDPPRCGDCGFMSL